MLDKILGSQLSFSPDTYLPAGTENGYNQITAGDQYDFKSYQYPITLGEKADPHYMVFYINVDSQSKYIGRSQVISDAPTIEQNRISSGIAQSAIAQVGKSVGKSIAEYIPDSIAEGAAVIGGLIADDCRPNYKLLSLCRELKSTVAGQFNKTTKRIKSSNRSPDTYKSRCRLRNQLGV